MTSATANVAASQTLAFGYNDRFVSGFKSNTIGTLKCTPIGTLTGASTMSDVQTYVVGLLCGSGSDGSTTQTKLGGPEHAPWLPEPRAF